MPAPRASPEPRLPASSTDLSPSGAARAQQPAAPVPAKIQGIVNGHSVSMDVVLDLKPPENRHIKSFVMQDVAPIIQQCRQLATTIGRAGQLVPEGGAPPVAPPVRSVPAPPGFDIPHGSQHNPPSLAHLLPSVPHAAKAAVLQAPPGFGGAGGAGAVKAPAVPPGFSAPTAPVADAAVPRISEPSVSPFSEASPLRGDGGDAAGSSIFARSPSQACPLLNGFSTSSLGFTFTQPSAAKPTVNLDAVFPAAVPRPASAVDVKPSRELEAAMQRLWAEPVDYFLGLGLAPRPPSQVQHRKPLYARGTDAAARQEAGGVSGAQGSGLRAGLRVGGQPPIGTELRAPPGFEALSMGLGRGADATLHPAQDPVVNPASLSSAVGPIGSGSANLSGLQSHLQHGITTSHR